VDIEFGVHFLEVGIHGARLDAQRAGDLAVRVAACNEPRDLHLARGERIPAPIARRWFAWCGVADEMDVERFGKGCAGAGAARPLAQLEEHNGDKRTEQKIEQWRKLFRYRHTFFRTDW